MLGEGKEETVFELQDDYPITKTQQGIFVSCLGDPNTTVYNIPILYCLDDKVDLTKLELAIKEAINAHPYLKATLFSAPNGDIRAKRNDGSEVTIERLKVDALPRPFAFKPYKL